MRSSLRRAAAGEGAEAMCSSATLAINTARASAAAPGKTKRTVTTAAHIVGDHAHRQTAAHITGTTDVSTPAGVALYATAASRLRAPKLEALPAFHVKCSSPTPAGVVFSSLRRAAAGEGAAAHDLQPGEVLGACRSGRRRGGVQLYQLWAAWDATWAAQWHLARAVGKHFRGCRAKRLYFH